MRTASGADEHHLAVSTVVQQLSQVVGVVTMLVAITVLARNLSLTEFGTYGLLLSLTGYLLFVQASVETASIKAIAEATDQHARDRAFSTALTLYAIAGPAAGAIIAVAGGALLRILGIPAALHHEAQLSVFALAALTAVGWPLKVFQDVLRGSRQFVLAAVAETLAYVAVGAALIILALDDAALWLLVAAGASLPATIGAVSAVIVAVTRLPFRYRRSQVTAASVRGFLHLSSYLLVGGIADLVIYTLDRAILATFRSTATVALYEGPIRAHNLVRQVHGTLSTVVLPASARYLAENDVQRARALLVRGTRYTLAAVVPLVIVLTVLAKPILATWLGDKYSVAATAMTLLVGYWLVNANTGVAGSMLVAAGKIRTLTVYSVIVALANLGLSLALTPRLGLNGVILGTVISYVVLFPFFLRLTLSTFHVSLRELAREAWLPAYLTGAILAGALLAVRLSLQLDTIPIVLGVSALGVLVYWAMYYLVWLRPSERLLVRNVALALVRR